MQFNPKKLPLASDVKIPLNDLWQHPKFSDEQMIEYPVITM
ncbi:MAG TPA: 2-amino-4-hydroxy-6-hydroxymethyldihydropteridine pyrophosphokinase, partial [Acinetobacter sp.]|nr:2-amino-4-hydroxy-6-hydroxymethyldihydropteridine pyrophosphokinase [Acinetobacter sp.]